MMLSNSAPKLHDLLKANQQYQPQYEDGQANHLSMSLIALFFLGAEAQHLQKFYDQYAPKLEPMAKSSVKIDQHNWQEYVGTHQHFADYVEFFTSEHQRLTAEQLLKTYLPELFLGVAADGFHCLIRLAYAVELWQMSKGHADVHIRELASIADNEMIISLAYWADAYMSLPKVAGQKSIDDLLPQLLKEDQVAVSVNESLFYKQIFQVANSSVYQNLAMNLIVTNQTLNKITNAILELYTEFPVQTFLHMVTSAHAIRLVLPFIENKEDAINCYWRALVAAYLTVKKETREIPADFLAMNWHAVQEKALISNDDHATKLVYSAMKEAQHYSRSKYLLIAARAVNHIA